MNVIDLSKYRIRRFPERPCERTAIAEWLKVFAPEKGLYALPTRGRND